MNEDPKVRKIKCLCGKARNLAVIDGSPLSKDEKELLDLGLEVETISLEEARKTELCFTCDVDPKGFKPIVHHGSQFPACGQIGWGLSFSLDFPKVTCKKCIAKIERLYTIPDIQFS